MVALRLPLARVKALVQDPEPRVRIALAMRLTGESLAVLFDDRTTRSGSRPRGVPSRRC